MHHDDKLRTKLIAYLQDMYALENQIVETLEKHAGQAKDDPEAQARIKEHLEATKLHRSRMEERLTAYGEQPSTVKGAISNVMGAAMGAGGGVRPEALARDLRDEYVTEHLEIASYTLLIAMARAYGDQETVRAAELNLRDEFEMQRWLVLHLPEGALLALQQEGITIPPDAWQFARQVESTSM